jgi:hypothetical protein
VPSKDTGLHETLPEEGILQSVSYAQIQRENLVNAKVSEDIMMGTF